jgi:hypothetical protein
LKRLITSVSLFSALAMLSGTNYAGDVIVPEIDGGMTAIAIGLTVGVVALIREHRRKK